MSPEPTRRDTVLVVDDSPETLSFLTDALDASGYMVLVARRGSDALSLVQEITPDVILMDAIMPGMDGFETCRLLKSTSGLASVPVIFMTGLSDTEHIVKGLAAGGVDYVTKPIAPDELLARITVHLANARVSHGARAALDATGRFLLAVDGNGMMRWCTRQAGTLLARAFPSFSMSTFALPPPIQDWLASVARAPSPADPDAASVALGEGVLKLSLSYIGQSGADEFLLRLNQNDNPADEMLLASRLSLTPREAQVLLWTARGKSNRDIGTILGVSPRTVNKHLDQIYAKLGVDNRTSAASRAIHALGQS